MHHSGGGQQHLASCSKSRSPKNPTESRTKNAAPPTARQPCQPSCNFLGDWKSGLEHFHPSQKVFSFRKPQKNCEFTRPPWTNLTRMLGNPTCLLVPFPGGQKPYRENCSALIEKPAAKFISKHQSTQLHFSRLSSLLHWRKNLNIISKFWNQKTKMEINLSINK